MWSKGAKTLLKKNAPSSRYRYEDLISPDYLENIILTHELKFPQELVGAISYQNFWCVWQRKTPFLPRNSRGTKTGTRVHSDAPPERQPERGYVRMFPWNEKTGTRVRSPKPPFYETAAPLCPLELAWAMNILPFSGFTCMHPYWGPPTAHHPHKQPPHLQSSILKGAARIV